MRVYDWTIIRPVQEMNIQYPIPAYVICAGIPAQMIKKNISCRLQWEQGSVLASLYEVEKPYHASTPRYTVYQVLQYCASVIPAAFYDMSDIQFVAQRVIHAEL